MSIHDGHRDRMRRQLKTSGMDSLSDVQVLEVLLYYAAPRGDTNPAAHALLTRFGTLDGVFSAPEAELKKVDGVGDAAAQLIALVPQVARRCLMSRSAQIQVLDTTSKCGQYLLPYFHGEHEEVVYLLCLDAKCKALDCVLIHRGCVNVASMSGLVVNPLPQQQCAYNSSKAGVIMLTKCMANEWAQRGVRVNAICPGFTDTPLTARRLSTPNDPVVAKWIGGTPMGRVAQPDEMVGLVLYFASDASTFTTGAVLSVDGGYTCL